MVSVDTNVSIRVEQRIDDVATWHLIVAGGTAKVGAGPLDDPEVTIAISASVAEKIATGTQSAQRAFLVGELQIGGDIKKLLSCRKTLEQLAALLQVS